MRMTEDAAMPMSIEVWDEQRAWAEAVIERTYAPQQARIRVEIAARQEDLADAVARRDPAAIVHEAGRLAERLTALAEWDRMERELRARFGGGDS